jgi:hypothetical protein
MERDDKLSRHHFVYDNNIRSIDVDDLGSTDNSTKTDIKSTQLSANPVTYRTRADYPRYNLRSGAVREVDAIPRSGSKNDKKSVRVTSEPVTIMITMIYNPEQVTRGRLNAYCFSHATSDDRKSDSRGEEVANNYEICTMRRHRRYGERDVGDSEPAAGTHNTKTDDRTITTDQIRELINERECITFVQKQ